MALPKDCFPDFSEFKKKAQQGNLIPVYKEILADTETPVSAFMKLNAFENCFLLESVEGGEKWARYSFIGFNPATIFKSKGKNVTIKRGASIEEVTAENPLAMLRDMMQQYAPVEIDGLPRFFGGAVGYAGYDMVRFFESLPDATEDDPAWHDTYFMITDTLVIFDNLKHNVKVVYNIHVDEMKGNLRRAYDQAAEAIENIIELLNKPLKKTIKKSLPRKNKIASNFTKPAFKKIVEKAKSYIRAGDIIQVVLSQRFEIDLETDPFELYRSLRIINPSPYMYFIKMGKQYIVGSSPEVLVRLERNEIVVRPIAGTRKRGIDDMQDMLMENDLKQDPKEVAEHVMLVDLGRNDVGRVAEMGTVRVDDFMVVERYSHVMHLVSNVRGTLKKGRDAYDVFSACFPAGTVSGAPKIRAMEIIEELELQKRGPYAGAVGYFSFSGNMDFCITIRTMLVKNGKIYV
ncbi:MAG: anthranilate synthase component I, partial [Pseudomonadota bacterium]